MQLDDAEISGRFDSGRAIREYAEQQAKVRALEWAEQERRTRQRMVAVRLLWWLGVAVCFASLVSAVVAL